MRHKRQNKLNSFMVFFLALSVDFTSRTVLGFTQFVCFYIFSYTFTSTPLSLADGTIDQLSHSVISDLTGTALAVAVMMYMIHYFMKREDKRESFISNIIEKNTEATRINTQIMHEIKDFLKKEK